MPEKTLVAFDFDHTIIDENSDLYVRKLAPNGEIPKDIKDLYRDTGWTEYMGSIFQYLYENGITPEDMKAVMMEIKLVDGMKDLFQLLNCERFEVIIISDSNSVFIDWILKEFDIQKVCHKVFTNPAHFDEKGCLKIQYYHYQDWCQLSTVNLCKGQILESHIGTRKGEGVEFSQVAYIGDGTNDLCPCLKLSKTDLIFGREGYRLLKEIKKTEHPVMARVISWDTAHVISQTLS